MSAAKPRTDLSGYFKEISRRLQAQAEILTPIVTHHGEMGDNDHLWFAELLRQHMPHRIGVDTGFVVNCESDQKSKKWFAATADHRQDDKSIGPQSDILLLDVLHNAPLCSEQAFRVCPIEMVLGVIEVTRNLNAAKLKTDLDKLKRVRDLAAPGMKRYREWYFMPSRPLRPRAYMVGLGGDLSFDEIRNQVMEIDDALRPNAVLLLDRVLYIRRPFSTEFFEITEDVLFQFLAMLRFQIEKFPVGSTDLGAYLPGVARLLSDKRQQTDGEAAVGRCSLSAEIAGTELQSFEEE